MAHLAESPQASVVVVGAGVFGATAALALRRRGHPVVLLDPGPVPHVDASSTDVSKMVRMDYGSDVFYHELAEAALDGWDRWNAQAVDVTGAGDGGGGARPLYHPTGFLVLAPGVMSPGGFEHESRRGLVERGYAPERIGGDDLERRFPAWRGALFPDGYFSPHAGWAESAAVVARLAAACSAAGVEFVADGLDEVLSIGSRVAGVRTLGGSSLPADRVVVSAGAWTPSLLPWLTDVMWATAQPVLHLLPADGEPYRDVRFPPFAADISGSGWYGFPALPDGRVKIAHHGPGKRVEPRDRGDVSEPHVEGTRAFLADALPGLADAPIVDRRICLYCDTFDGDLWIDHDPDREGLIVATGGSGHAFKFAPVLGQVIADVVEGRPNRWADRFRWRAAGAPRREAARFAGR